MADAPVPTPAALSKGQIFLRRLGSTLFLWSIVLAAIFSTDPFVRSYVFLGLMIVLAAGLPRSALANAASHNGSPSLSGSALSELFGQ